MKMKVILLLIGLIKGISATAQIDPVWYNLMIPHDKIETIKDLLEKEGLELSVDNTPYLIVDFKDNKFFISRKSQKSRIRVFKILKETNDLYLVCIDNVELCDCKGNTFIYKKTNNQLLRIQRPFSFSLKRNLIKRLEDMELDKPDGYDNSTFCEILKAL